MRVVTLTFLLCFFAIMSLACSDNTEGLSDEDEGQLENLDVDEEKNDEKEKQEEAVDENDSLGGEEQQRSGDFVIDMSAKAHLEDDVIIVEGNSNLLPGTEIHLEANTLNEISHSIALSRLRTVDEVKEDGSFHFEVDRPDVDVFRLYVIVPGDRLRDDILEHYGENGERMEGAHIVRTESSIRREVVKNVQIEAIIYLQEDTTQYALTSPDLFDPPEDYGDTEVWIEADLTTDHRYVYVDGRSNLVEGTRLRTNYWRHVPSSFVGMAEHMHPYFTTVRKDGRFSVVIPYTTITEESFVIVEAGPTIQSELPTLSEDVYGEDFEHITGDIVIEATDNVRARIEAKLFLEPPELSVPEEVFITKDDGETMLTFPDDILFDFDQSSLKEEAKEVIKEVLPALDSLKDGTIIEIRGHTDNEGDPDYNYILSEERAESVYNFVRNSGESLDHIEFRVKAFGETAPIASNEDEEGRERNRRVELVIDPRD
ncbi:OmpA family protein [Evansella cellulosilytica]|uniref:OmpA/MotB domain protein n=1 Tax=Evansella cellulosilytica (strain ATCC 21833 / DSM 2522 / FERM P-1141 / JCM 9156 / N-4) TaxID=649639 RepID=E6TSM5_EVAC2|nr:OmpA family protein [Evansella cellulosilytica]ADU29533.1 OmpA/MotB domain protein [Evansella cellulosilytica DSM 2522]